MLRVTEILAFCVSCVRACVRGLLDLIVTKTPPNRYPNNTTQTFSVQPTIHRPQKCPAVAGRHVSSRGPANRLLGLESEGQRKSVSGPPFHKGR